MISDREHAKLDEGNLEVRLSPFVIRQETVKLSIFYLILTHFYQFAAGAKYSQLGLFLCDEHMRTSAESLSRDWTRIVADAHTGSDSGIFAAIYRHARDLCFQDDPAAKIAI